MTTTKWGTRLPLFWWEFDINGRAPEPRTWGSGSLPRWVYGWVQARECLGLSRWWLSSLSPLNLPFFLSIFCLPFTHGKKNLCNADIDLFWRDREVNGARNNVHGWPETARSNTRLGDNVLVQSLSGVGIQERLRQGDGNIRWWRRIYRNLYPLSRLPSTHCCQVAPEVLCWGLFICFQDVGRDARRKWDEDATAGNRGCLHLSLISWLQTQLHRGTLATPPLLNYLLPPTHCSALPPSGDRADRCEQSLLISSHDIRTIWYKGN